MKILNTEKEDYHIHSINFSDGWNTVDEIAKFAGEIGMREIAITDHSQATIDIDKLGKRVFRSAIKRWKNIHNDVVVKFGVEADVLNEKGDICSHIDGLEGEFIILSIHEGIYSGNPKNMSKAFIKALERHKSRINIIGHVCLGLSESDAKKVILAANKFKIPLELNARYYLLEPKKWKVLLENADAIYINSDAHLLNDLRDLRKAAREQLKKDGYL